MCTDLTSSRLRSQLQLQSQHKCSTCLCNGIATTIITSSTSFTHILPQHQGSQCIHNPQFVTILRIIPNILHLLPLIPLNFSTTIKKKWFFSVNKSLHVNLDPNPLIQNTIFTILRPN